MGTLNKKSEEKFKLIADSIRSYPFQLKDSWETVLRIYIPESYKKVNNVVLCGMGGSALAGKIVNYLLIDRIRVPFETFTEYKPPYYLNNETLVISSSYSGNTEETINFTLKAFEKSSKLFGITTNGKIKDIFYRNNLPCYIINEKYNPSKQPRMALGYFSGAILALLNRLDLVDILNEEFEETITKIFEVLTLYDEKSPSNKNFAKIFADKLLNKIPILISSEHLKGVTISIRNQINENAKTFCDFFDIPELNHHLIEGLWFPKKIREIFHFIFIQSKFYSKDVLKRYSITYDVVSKNGFEYSVFYPYSSSKFSEAFETLIFGSFLAYHLSKNYNLDIISIPWVNYFKKRLSKKK